MPDTRILARFSRDRYGCTFCGDIHTSIINNSFSWKKKGYVRLKHHIYVDSDDWPAPELKCTLLFYPVTILPSASPSLRLLSCSPGAHATIIPANPSISILSQFQYCLKFSHFEDPFLDPGPFGKNKRRNRRGTKLDTSTTVVRTGTVAR